MLAESFGGRCGAAAGPSVMALALTQPNSELQGQPNPREQWIHVYGVGAVRLRLQVQPAQAAGCGQVRREVHVEAAGNAVRKLRIDLDVATGPRSLQVAPVDVGGGQPSVHVQHAEGDV